MPTEAPPPSRRPSDQSILANKDVLLAILTELGAAKRFRSESENLYAAAAVGSFGAVAWGVATIATVDRVKALFWTHPALIAAIGVGAVAAAVLAKIISDVDTFMKIKADEADAAELLSIVPGVDGMIPADMLRREAGIGRWASSLVVGVAAASAIAFCLSVLISN